MIVLGLASTHLELLSVQPHEETSVGPQEVRENLRDLLDSIGENNLEKTELYRNILRRKAAHEKQMFDAVKEDWQSAKAGKLPNLHHKSNTGEVAALKREVHEPDSEMEKAPIFTGTSDSFESAVERRAIIVDKTRFIKQLLLQTERDLKPVKVLLRPRQYGRSFFLSMLMSFFQNKRKLFKNFDIGDGGNVCDAFPWKEYPVVHFTLIPGYYNAKEYERSLTYLLMDEARHLKVPCPNDSVSLQEAARWLFTQLERKHGPEIILLIDEYDAPYREAALSHNEAHREIWAVLRTFYETLNNFSSAIKFGFITGCPRVGPAFEADFAVDISEDPSYSEIMGFTEAEVDRYYGAALIKQIKRLVKPPPKSDGEVALLAQQIKANLTSWYYGHRFTTQNTRIFPALSVISFLEKLPSRIEPYWAETAMQSIAVYAVTKAMQASPVHMIETLAMNLENENATYKITDHDLHRPLNVTALKTDFVNVIKLLYQIGYFTIKATEGSVHYVGCTNRETRLVLLHYIVRGQVLEGERRREWILNFIEKTANCETRKNFETFFSEVEDIMSESDALIGFKLSRILSRNHIDETRRASKQESRIFVPSSDGQLRVSRKRADFVYDKNPRSTFIFDYAVYSKRYNTGECIEYHMPRFKNNGKKISCIGILFANTRKKVKRAGNAQILNWEVISFHEDHSTVLGRFHHPTPYALFKRKRESSSRRNASID